MGGPRSPQDSALEVCVLMPVHRGTPAAQFREAVASVLEQHHTGAELLIVEDGPLTDAHEAVMDEAETAPARVVRLRMETAVGIAAALQAGVEHTTCAWIARMDADDVARPDRLTIQIRLAASGRYDVIGSAMTEFETDPEHPAGLRTMPVDHDEIVRRLRRTNPINHPTVLFRRDAALGAGGYRALPGLEDYDLWARMAAQGARFVNVRDPLVSYRVDAGLFRRRRGRALIRAEIEMQRRLVGYGLIGRPRAAVNAVVRIGFRLLPPPLMKIAYAAMRRHSNVRVREQR